MEKINPISDELKQLGSVLAGFPAVNTPYTAPGGYFDSLAEVILKKAKEQSGQSASEELESISPLLSGISKKSPFSVPDNYFTELPANVMSGAQAVELVNEELENLSPLMASLKSTNVYSVPKGYFESLPGSILNKMQIAAPTGGKVINGSFRRRFQLAAAAVITGLVITASFFALNRNTVGPEVVSVKGLEARTAQASDQEILNYLAIQPVPLVDSLIITDPEIKADAIMEMLANVSDEELQQYLLLQSDTKIMIN